MARAIFNIKNMLDAPIELIRFLAVLGLIAYPASYFIYFKADTSWIIVTSFLLSIATLFCSNDTVIKIKHITWLFFIYALFAGPFALFESFLSHPEINTHSFGLLLAVIITAIIAKNMFSFLLCLTFSLLMALAACSCSITHMTITESHLFKAWPMYLIVSILLSLVISTLKKRVDLRPPISSLQDYLEEKKKSIRKTNPIIHSLKKALRYIESLIDPPRQSIVAIAILGIVGFPLGFTLYHATDSLWIDVTAFCLATMTLLCRYNLIISQKHLNLIALIYITFAIPFAFSESFISAPGVEAYQVGMILVVAILTIFCRNLQVSISLFFISFFTALAISKLNLITLFSNNEIISVLPMYLLIVAVLFIFNFLIKRERLQLSKAHAQEKTASKTKSQFISNMNHDFRTPISGMLGMSHIIHKEVKRAIHANEKKRHDILQSIEKNCQLLINASEDLTKVFTKVIDEIEYEAGAKKNKVESFDLEEILSNITNLLIPASKYGSIKLSYLIEPSCPKHLFGNSGHLERILINLISNAIKFTPKGHIKISASSKNIINKNKKYSESIQLMIKISDTGIGIPKDKQKLIFEKFSRLSPSHKGIYSGSGYGLYAVKNYVDEMQGTISLKSTKGKGSEFTIKIPLRVSSSSQLSKKTSRDYQKETSKSTQKSAAQYPYHILIVEDCHVAATSTSILLKSMGCTTGIAKTGKDALEKISSSEYYDLIFMDIGLPDTNGIALSEQIHNFYRRKDLPPPPVVVVSGHGAETARHENNNEHIVDFITKPMRPETLEYSLNQYIAQRD